VSLTPEQVWFFRHNGFLQLPEPLPAERVEQLKEAVWRDIEEAVEPVVRDRQGRVVRISDLWGRGAPFRESLTCPEVLEPLTSLLGPNIELITNRHNHACLRIAGDGTDYLHRDVLQWTRSIVTVIFYMEATTLENGCTRLVPGSHLLPGVETTNVTEAPWLQQSGLLTQTVPLPMPAGGLLAMDSLVVHGAGPNHTAGSRMSLTVGYHSVDELSRAENPRRVLVRGERIYLGNDRR
jgi:phytanoyl-CoA hydroxylase